jgi:hypothetical protein
MDDEEMKLMFESVDADANGTVSRMEYVIDFVHTRSSYDSFEAPASSHIAMPAGTAYTQYSESLSAPHLEATTPPDQGWKNSRASGSPTCPQVPPYHLLKRICPCLLTRKEKVRRLPRRRTASHVVRLHAPPTSLSSDCLRSTWTLLPSSSAARRAAATFLLSSPCTPVLTPACSPLLAQVELNVPPPAAPAPAA